MSAVKCLHFYVQIWKGVHWFNMYEQWTMHESLCNNNRWVAGALRDKTLIFSIRQIAVWISIDFQFIEWVSCFISYKYCSPWEFLNNSFAWRFFVIRYARHTSLWPNICVLCIMHDKHRILLNSIKYIICAPANQSGKWIYNGPGACWPSIIIIIQNELKPILETVE